MRQGAVQVLVRCVAPPGSCTHHENALLRRFVSTSAAAPRCGRRQHLRGSDRARARGGWQWHRAARPSGGV